MVRIKTGKGIRMCGAECWLLRNKRVFPERGLPEQRSEGSEGSEPRQCLEDECSRQREGQMQSIKARSCLMASRRTSVRAM